MKALRTFLEWLRSQLKGSKHETPPEKSAARPRGEETSGQAVRVARIGSAAAGLWRRSLDSRVADDIKGIDTTDRGAGMANYEVDLSQSEFESELLQLGWAKELSLDGTVMNYAEG